MVVPFWSMAIHYGLKIQYQLLTHLKLGFYSPKFDLNQNSIVGASFTRANDGSIDNFKKLTYHNIKTPFDSGWTLLEKIFSTYKEARAKVSLTEKWISLPKKFDYCITVEDDRFNYITTSAIDHRHNKKCYGFTLYNSSHLPRTSKNKAKFSDVNESNDNK